MEKRHLKDKTNKDNTRSRLAQILSHHKTTYLQNINPDHQQPKKKTYLRRLFAQTTSKYSGKNIDSRSTEISKNELIPCTSSFKTDLMQIHFIFPVTNGTVKATFDSLTIFLKNRGYHSKQMSCSMPRKG